MHAREHREDAEEREEEEGDAEATDAEADADADMAAEECMADRRAHTSGRAGQALSPPDAENPSAADARQRGAEARRCSKQCETHTHIGETERT